MIAEEIPPILFKLDKELNLVIEKYKEKHKRMTNKPLQSMKINDKYIFLSKCLQRLSTKKESWSLKYWQKLMYIQLDNKYYFIKRHMNLLLNTVR